MVDGGLAHDGEDGVVVGGRGIEFGLQGGEGGGDGVHAGVFGEHEEVGPGRGGFGDAGGEGGGPVGEGGVLADFVLQEG